MAQTLMREPYTTNCGPASAALARVRRARARTEEGHHQIVALRERRAAEAELHHVGAGVAEVVDALRVVRERLAATVRRLLRAGLVLRERRVAGDRAVRRACGRHALEARLIRARAASALGVALDVGDAAGDVHLDEAAADEQGSVLGVALLALDARGAFRGG